MRLNEQCFSPGKTLLIRADTLAGLGSGHILRMTALGQAWISLGGKVIFCTNCKSYDLLNYLKQAGFTLAKISAPNPDALDVKTTKRLMQENMVGAIAIDGYHFDPEYQAELRTQRVPLLMVEDYNHHYTYQPDFLLVPSIDATRYGFSMSPWTIPLFGSAYALIRQEFIHHTHKKPQATRKIKHILITFGGEDKPNATLLAMQALHDTHWNGSVSVLCGALNQNHDSLLEFSKKYGYIFLPQQYEVAKLLSEVDCVIGSGGGTCWEAFYYGVPVFSIAIAANQISVLNSLKNIDALEYAGNILDIDRVYLTKRLNSFLDDSTHYTKSATYSKSLVDGNGAKRAAQLLYLHCPWSLTR